MPKPLGKVKSPPRAGFGDSDGVMRHLWTWGKVLLLLPWLVGRVQEWVGTHCAQVVLLGSSSAGRSGHSGTVA